MDQAISKSVNSLVGNNDVNLNTIVKMATLNEINPLEPTKIEDILLSIKKSNAMEQYWYEKEMSLTMDSKGNLVYAHQNISPNDIVNVTSQGNTESELPKPAGSE